MTTAVLGMGWVGLAILVSPAGAWFVWRLSPRAQVALIGAAIAGLVLIPAAIALTTLSATLGNIDGASLVQRCGTLIAALLSDPLALPGATLSVLLLLGGTIGIGVGAIRAWRSQRAARLLARDAGGGGTIIVDSPEQFAFTAGLLQPRVVVSRGVLEATSPEWRKVVLAHEEAHRKGRHPLFIFAAETFAGGVPLVPLRWAADGLRLGFEAVADEHATRAVRDKALVAEAIGGMALSPALAGAIGFDGHEVARVRRLLDAPTRIPFVFAAVVVVAILATVGVAGGHALHCADETLQSLAVTQCRLAG